jgi:hypothetical protein
MTHQETNALIVAITQLWPTVPFQADHGPGMVKVWQAVLADVPADAAQTVTIDHARRGDPFPPTPGAIAAAVHQLAARITGTGTPTADEAWATVQAQVSRRGWYQGAPDDTAWHPAVAAVVRAIGWAELCHGDTMVVRAHFLKLYPDAAARVTADRRQDTTLAMLGLTRPPAPSLEETQAMLAPLAMTADEMIDHQRGQR